MIDNDAMVNENAKACGKDWTRLPIPLCHWSFRFLDLRALSSMLSRCLSQIYQWKTWSRGTNGRLLFTLKVTVNLSNDNDCVVFCDKNRWNKLQKSLILAFRALQYLEIYLK